MMTREMIIQEVKALGDDATACRLYNGDINITIEDFEGFDEDYCEIDRELDNEDAVDAFIEKLEQECVSHDGDYYNYYHFEGFDVIVGYASFDI